jgi:hypothetical protein
MKNFEEKFSAWVDESLEAKERADFEAGLADPAAARREKEIALRLGALLRRHGSAPPLSNADFFQSQLMDRIAREEDAEPKPAAAPALFPWWRLVWAGAACLIVAAGLALFSVPQTPRVPTEAEFLAEVLKVSPGDDDISAAAFLSEDREAAVIWLEGLPDLPENGLEPAPQIQ